MMSFTDQMKAVRTAQQKKYFLFSQQKHNCENQQEILKQKKQLLDEVKSFALKMNAIKSKEQYCNLYSSTNYLEIIGSMKNQITEFKKKAKDLGLDTTALNLGDTDCTNLVEQQSMLSMYCYSNYCVHLVKMVNDFKIQLTANIIHHPPTAHL